ncbi:dihydrolipoamide acetyltransferase family protein [Streptomyces avicenniae]|uniref:dihydrolipoamide acetyltransferase family protein n=1 Tax=Streptomyces avicenniae TaxID=500153 RepID=UPI00069C9521|nr:dihydrolipoamide acetyltransferase family protein [Streptomyces avicenniae]
MSAQEFRLPDLGEGLTGAEIVRWLVEVGDTVAVDQPVVEVETAKAVVEVPVPYAGTVGERFGAPGEEIPVGAPLLRVTPSDAPAGASGPVLVGYGTSPPVAAPVPAPPRPAPAPAPAGAQNGRTVPVVSPLVRRIARERGIDLRTVSGTGPGGLVLRSDVEAATATTRVPLRGTAAAMAEKLTRSHTEIPAATCWLDVDATELLAARRHTGLPLLALLARVCVSALVRHPQLNATVDTEAREIVRHGPVHLGIATDTERGLLVPVVRDAHLLPARRLADELTRLTGTAHAGVLSPAELTGATFTLNNYGVLGVDGSTPLLNHPEAGMLGVGRIAEKPWAHEGTLALRHVVQLSLTFDHRVCDGAIAAAFLRHVAERVERPVLLLADL